MVNEVEQEREACARVADAMAAEIREKGLPLTKRFARILDEFETETALRYMGETVAQVIGAVIRERR